MVAQEELNTLPPFRHSGGTGMKSQRLFSLYTSAFDRPEPHTREAESNPFQPMSTFASEETKWGHGRALAYCVKGSLHV